MNEEKAPIRTCIVCRKRANKYKLIHITRNKRGEVGIDYDGYRAGRGAYLCRDKTCIKGVRKTKALNRAFRDKIDDKTYEELEKELDKGFGDARTGYEGGNGSER